MVPGHWFIIHNTETLEYFNVFYGSLFILVLLDKLNQMSYQLLPNKVIDNQFIAFQYFGEGVQSGRIITFHYILNHKVNPLAYMNFEHLVALDHDLYHLVAGAVQFIELLFFVGAVLKDIVVFVDLHVV